jgi:Cytochrome b5-like Heme/Steroid binding domain
MLFVYPVSSTDVENQWIIIDAKVFDLSKFKALHPGGLSVLLDPEIGTTCSFTSQTP